MTLLLLALPEALQQAETYLTTAVAALSAVVVVFWRGQVRAYAKLERRAVECDRRSAECEIRAAGLAARLEGVLSRVQGLERLLARRDDPGLEPSGPGA